MKTIYFNSSLKKVCLFFLISFISQIDLIGQWAFNTIGNNYSASSNLLGTFTGNTSGTIAVSSSEGGVSNSLTPKGLLLKSLSSPDSQQNSYLEFLKNAVDSALNSIPIEKWFKAKVGRNDTLKFNYRYNKANSLKPSQVNSLILEEGSYIGSKESGYDFQTPENKPTKINETTTGNIVTGTLQSIVNFPVGSTKGYVIIPITEVITNFWVLGFTVPPKTAPETIRNIIVLPFIVEGPVLDLSNDRVAILGTFKEPAVPHLILHNPPGDMSSATFQTTTNTCREISQSLANSQSTSANLKLTLGIAGSAGLFVTTDFEFSASISSGVGVGQFTVNSNGSQNCITVQQAISTQPGSPANEGSIYMGYSSEIAYGMYPLVQIQPGLPLSVTKVSALIFATVPNSAVDFYYTKADILEDMRLKQQLADNTSMENIRRPALAQIDIWRQVLRNDSINIHNPNNEELQSISISGNQGGNPFSHTRAINSSETIEVSNFIEGSFGASFVAMFGGSGVEGGFEFKTNRTLGKTVTVESSSEVTVAYNLQDFNQGDLFKIKVVKDPTYGTPIFLLDSLISKTSCPYEGGIQRDQPKLEINGSAASNTTVSNISLGNSGNFKVKVCNNSAEIRDYGFGFVNESIANDVFISSTAGTGSSAVGESITKLGTITGIPARGCKTTIYDVNVARRFANSPMSYSNLEFVTFAECEPDIKSSIFATINFATPPPPTNVSASTKEICAGAPVQLSGNCPVGVPTWFDDPIGGLERGTGSTITVNPSSNTTYYLGCVATLYNRDRIAAGEIFVTSPFPTLNLTSDLSFNALQIANNTLTASNKIIDPARVIYKAGKSLLFSEGFEAKAGSTFEAKIGGCVN